MNPIFSQETSSFIITFLLQVTMIFVFFLVLSKFLFSQIHVAKYNLLFFGLLLILVCPLISTQIKLSFFNLKVKPQVFHADFSETKATAPTFVIAEKEKIVNENIKAALPLKETNNQSTQITSNASVLNSPVSVEEKSFIESFSLPSVLFVLWLVGFMFFFVKVVISFYRINQLTYKGTPLLNREILKIVDDATVAFQLKIKPQIIITQATISPFVFGVWNPKIILPNLLIENYDFDSFKSILYHELAHIKRLDIAKGYLQIILQNVLWFHPLIYIYNKEMSYSREEICDNYSLNHHQPACYASILAKLAESTLNQNKILGVNSMVSSKSELFNRVKNILDPKRTTSTKMKIFDIVTLSLIVMLAFISIGTFRLIEAEETVKPLNASVKTKIELLDQKVTIDLTRQITFQEMVDLLSKTINKKIKVHESVAKLASAKYSFFINAQNMTLKNLLNSICRITTIDYTIINDQIVFCSSETKDLIDTTFLLQVISVEKLLKDINKGIDKEHGLKATHLKELIQEKIAKESWNEAREIIVQDENLLIVHNKNTLKSIENWLLEMESENKKRSEEVAKNNLYFGSENIVDINITQTLKNGISFNWEGNSLEEVMNEILKSQKNLSIIILKNENISLEQFRKEKVSLQSKNLSLDKVLAFIFSQYSLKIQVMNGAVWIADKEFLNKQLFTQIFDVTCLINQKNKENPFTSDHIKEIITSQLLPSSWAGEKGTSILCNNNCLIVTHNREMMGQITDLLVVLKKAMVK